ncbi:MAG TPA: asparagine synthase-related protein [Gammaproteobacteria bacterium]|nr:asparagine synthase-related protein [Gammaproteobacteria bacterium]
MVRAVLVVPRYPGQPNRLDAYCEALNRKLAGDNIDPRPATLVRSSGVSAALLNPSAAAQVQGASIAVGTLLAPRDDWHVPKAALPDGSFALLRADDARVELASDSVGSRTLWYAMTDRELIASTSQRAIVTLLGSFEPNRAALPWMLSSGTLGPTAAWDARVQRLQPGQRLLLDRASWRLESRTEPVVFEADESRPRAAHLERLLGAVSDACRRWSFDARKWVLTLSGGADSRSLLCLLRERGIATVTWGLPQAPEEEGNDAQIARTLAQTLCVPHRFFAIDDRGDSVNALLDRFLSAGEGRVARISGYVDGFRVWKTLFDEGYHGVIRGDEAFGSVPVRNAYSARWAASLTTLTDYFPDEEIETFELPEQSLPEALLRRDNETLATWRDRLYQQSRVPTLLAGLTDLKTAYVDVGNPLLATSVLECVRALPDDLRTEKRLWRDVVDQQLPNVAMATQVAIPSLTDFLMDPRVVDALLEELCSEAAASVLAPLLRARCCSALRAALREAPPPGRNGERQRATGFARVVPAKLRAVMRHWSRFDLPPVVLAFRAYVATRMHRMLRLDAATPPADQQPAVNA